MARKKIERPEDWGKGALWHNGCYCADGALLEAAPTGDLLRSRASSYLSAAARSRGFETASRFNDAPGTTHADVLALFDDAIRLARAS